MEPAKSNKVSRFIELNNLDWFSPFEGLKAKVVHTDIQTISFWEIDQDAVLPEHKHPHRQVTIVTKGTLSLTVDGETKVMKPGMMAVIPGDTLHSALALTDVEVTDVFHPIREDFKVA